MLTCSLSMYHGIMKLYWSEVKKKSLQNYFLTTLLTDIVENTHIWGLFLSLISETVLTRLYYYRRKPSSACFLFHFPDFFIFLKKRKNTISLLPSLTSVHIFLFCIYQVFSLLERVATLTSVSPSEPKASLSLNP